MFAFYRELEGTAHLTLHAFKRVGMLRVPPVMEEFMRQVYFTGASATGGIVLRGAFIGTLIIAYVIEVLNADAALAVKMLLWVVLREVGPLIAAVLVIQRSGTAVATEPALREISGEIASLRRMRIDLYDYLVVPRVHAMALSNAALTLYVQFIAVGGGMVLSSLIVGVPLDEMLTTSSCWRARSTWCIRSSRACCSAARSRWSPATTACTRAATRSTRCRARRSAPSPRACCW